LRGDKRQEFEIALLKLRATFGRQLWASHAD
jgi:hypothetical protein